MKNKLLTLLAVCGLSLPAFSQTSDSVQYKNQLGIIASPSLQYLFSANQSLPVGLIYKRQVKTNEAWRLTVKGSYNNQYKPNGPFYSNSNYISQKNTYFFAETLVGYEWQKELTKRWTFYYGADAGVRYSSYKVDFDFTNYSPDQNGPTGFGYGNTSSQNYVLQPMAGIKFNLSSRDRKSTRLNSSHSQISYAVFCL